MSPTFIANLMTRRWAMLAALIVLTVVLSVFALRVGIDNSVQVWFVEDDPALAAYNTFQDTFGNDEVIVLAVVDPQGVWQASTLNTLNRLTSQIEKVDGITRVYGIPRARLIAGGLGSLEVTQAMTAGVEVNDDEAKALRKRIQGDLVAKDRLAVADGKVALLFAQMAPGDDIDAIRPSVLEGVHKAIADTLGNTKLESHMAGIGVVYNELNRISQTEGALFMGAAFFLIFVMLWPLFRSMAAVLTAVGAVACALLMTRGLYGIFERDENMVTMTLPVLVLVIGVADCIHILRYRAAHLDAPVNEVLAKIIRPCFFTTLTTMVGFASLATSKMALVRDLGIFAACGIGLAFISSFVMCTFALSFEGFTVRPPSKPQEGAVGSLLSWSARFATANKEAVLAMTALIILVSAYGVSRVEVDTYSLGFLANDNPVRASSEAIEELVGPFTPLEIVFDGHKKEAIAENPELLRGVAAFQEALKKDPRVRDVVSLADVLARVHQVNMGPDSPFELAADSAMLAQDIEMYGAGQDNQLDQLTDAERRKVRVTASVPVLSARGYRDLIRDTLALAEKHVPSGVSVEASGYLPLYVRMMDYIVESQVVSFGVAFVVVFILIGLLFGSLRVAALSVLPNVLPVFVTLGVMGFCGVNLDVATVTITAILIGIVVDDSIHYLHRFREELPLAQGDFEAAAAATAIGAGRAIGATSIIFSLGFMVLVLASVKSIVCFGLLTALAMVVALVGDLLVLPAILITLKPKLDG